MINHIIADRYARALSTAIEDDAKLEEALAVMEAFAELVAQQHDLRSALSNPVIDIEARVRVLEEVLAKLDTPGVVAQLLIVLLRRGRVSVVGDVAHVFSQVVDERLNRAAAQVSTAAPLTADQEQRIRDGLEAFSGKTLRMQYRVDSNIVGGVVARIGGRVVDGSLATRLERVNQVLTSEEIE